MRYREFEMVAWCPKRVSSRALDVSMKAQRTCRCVNWAWGSERHVRRAPVSEAVIQEDWCSCSWSWGLPVLTREVLACPGHLRLCFSAQPEALQPVWLRVRVPGRAGCRKLAAPGPAPSGPIPPPVPRAHLTPTDGVQLPAELSRAKLFENMPWLWWRR